MRYFTVWSRDISMCMNYYCRFSFDWNSKEESGSESMCDWWWSLTKHANLSQEVNNTFQNACSAVRF